MKWIINDIFGHPFDSEKKGLMQCCNTMDFDKKYKEVKPNWMKIESQYTTRSGTEFTSYFEKYKYGAIKQKMSSFATKSHHFSLDYGQNAVEWLNYLTKEEIDTESNVKKSHKTVPIITCFKKLKERSSRLYRNAIKVICRERPYFLSPAYEHLKCTYDQFKDLTRPEKENLLRRMFTYTPNPKVLLNNGYLLDDDEIEPQKADLFKANRH